MVDMRHVAQVAAPIVHHVYREHAEGGQPWNAALWAATMAGIMAGAGMEPYEALAALERLERWQAIPHMVAETPTFREHEARMLSRRGYPVPADITWPEGWRY